MLMNHLRSLIFLLSITVMITSEAKSSKTGFGIGSFCSETKTLNKSFIYTSKDKIIIIERPDNQNKEDKNNRHLLLIKEVNHRIPPEFKSLMIQEIYQCTLEFNDCKFEKNIILGVHKPSLKDIIELKEKQKIFIDRIKIKSKTEIRSQDFINFNKLYNLEITTPQKDILSIKLSIKVYLQDMQFTDIELVINAEIALSEDSKPQDLLEKELKIHLNSERYQRNFEALAIKELAKFDLYLCK